MPPSKTARPAAHTRKSADSGKSGSALTHESIARDLDTFRKAGGRIEVLGNTPVLTRIEAPAAPANAAPARRKAG